MSSWQHLQIDKYSLNSLLPRTFKNALWIISYDVVHIKHSSCNNNREGRSFRDERAGMLLVVQKWQGNALRCQLCSGWERQLCVGVQGPNLLKSDFLDCYKILWINPKTILWTRATKHPSCSFESKQQLFSGKCFKIRKETEESLSVVHNSTLKEISKPQHSPTQL